MSFKDIYMQKSAGIYKEGISHAAAMLVGGALGASQGESMIEGAGVGAISALGLNIALSRFQRDPTEGGLHPMDIERSRAIHAKR